MIRFCSFTLSLAAVCHHLPWGYRVSAPPPVASTLFPREAYVGLCDFSTATGLLSSSLHHWGRLPLSPCLDPNLSHENPMEVCADEYGNSPCKCLCLPEVLYCHISSKSDFRNLLEILAEFFLCGNHHLSFLCSAKCEPELTSSIFKEALGFRLPGCPLASPTWWFRKNDFAFHL